MAIYGAGLAGYVPLTALIPMMAPDQKGAGVSVVNLGSGLSNFVGPLLVTLLVGLFGAAGVLYTIAALYFVSSILTTFLKTPDELNQNKSNDHNSMTTIAN